MTRLRITIKAVIEYDANPAHYPNPSPREMLAIDLDNADQDPFLFLEGNGVDWSTHGEVVSD